MSKDPDKQPEDRSEQSFADILNEFESATKSREKRTAAPAPKAKGRGRNRPAAPPPLRGTVVGISGDVVLIDYGGKAEGVINSSDLLAPDGTLSVQRGDTLDVAITGFNSEGLATLSRMVGPRPRDWDA